MNRISSIIFNTLNGYMPFTIEQDSKTTRYIDDIDASKDKVAFVGIDTSSTPYVSTQLAIHVISSVCNAIVLDLLEIFYNQTEWTTMNRCHATSLIELAFSAFTERDIIDTIKFRIQESLGDKIDSVNNGDKIVIVKGYDELRNHQRTAAKKALLKSFDLSNNENGYKGHIFMPRGVRYNIAGLPSVFVMASTKNVIVDKDEYMWVNDLIATKEDRYQTF